MPTGTSIKFMTFTTSAGFTPNYGDVSADFRGDLAIGAKDGDNHHTFFEIKNASPQLVDLFLQIAPEINRKSKEGNLSHIVEAMEAHLPETERHIIDGLLSMAGGIPTVRIGVWSAHG